MSRRRAALALSLLLLFLLPLSIASQSQSTRVSTTVKTSDLDAEVTNFFSKEMAAHLADIKPYNPSPDKVLGAGSSGEYTWGTFMSALGSYAELSGKRTLAERELAHEVGQIGLLEYRLGGTRFSQLYAVLALRRFGRDLNANPVWQSLTEEERAQWRKFLDISAFYDAKTQKVINLPENYLGVAARIASISYQLGLLKDRVLLDGVLTRAARPFMNGGLYSDDAPPTGRFDRYSNEYARFVWDAAEVAGRKDIQDAVRPSLKEQMRLWWDLILPDGYGYTWGRSMGVVSYEDTLEIVGFLARHPESRPAPLSNLASAYYQSWRWLRHDYNDKKHVLSVFAFGRGNYSYISLDREWQQTTSFFGKAASAHALFMEAMAHENITQFAPEIKRPGLPGFAAPVEQVYPSLTPFIELADGRVLVAGDGADEIEPAADGKSLRVVWHRWAIVGGKAGELTDPHLTSEVVWRIQGTTLTREETLKSNGSLNLRRWWIAMPTTASRSEVQYSQGQRWDRFESGEGTLMLSVTADWPLQVSLLAMGDSALGRGARGAIPLNLIYKARDLRLTPEKSAHWQMTIKVEGKK
jgi:hypothetical protein